MGLVAEGSLKLFVAYDVNVEIGDLIVLSNGRTFRVNKLMAEFNNSHKTFLLDNTDLGSTTREVIVTNDLTTETGLLIATEDGNIIDLD